MPDFGTALDALPRVRLAPGPTPLQPLSRLRDHLGGPSRVPHLLIKRDDLNGIALGGNKLRKLEFLVADALAQHCDTLLTAGAAQSNHCRLTAAVGAMYGLETHLCLRGPKPERYTGNLALDEWLGAFLQFALPGQNVSNFMRDVAEALRANGQTPYVIPIGGSNAVGALGYVEAIREFVGQHPGPASIVVPVGSGGTMAGLIAGGRLFAPAGKVFGVGVALPNTDSWQTDVSQLANETLHLLGDGSNVSPQEVECPMDWMGPRYGEPTPEGNAAIQMLARTEGIFLDPVYTGKAFAALLHWIKEDRFKPTDQIIFGIPAVHLLCLQNVIRYGSEELAHLRPAIRWQASERQR